jgi:hypothetical protein
MSHLSAYLGIKTPHQALNLRNTESNSHLRFRVLGFHTASANSGTGVRLHGWLGDRFSIEKPNIHTCLLSDMKSLANKKESIYKAKSAGTSILHIWIPLSVDGQLFIDCQWGWILQGGCHEKLHPSYYFGNFGCLCWTRAERGGFYFSLQLAIVKERKT